MRTPVFRYLAVMALALALAMAGSQPVRADQDEFRSMEVATDRELDAARGGYSFGNNLVISFGIDKAVYVNGILQATSSLNFMTSGGGLAQTGPITPQGQLTLVQVGPGNTAAFDPGTWNSGALTVVQNSLDQQLIQNITKISATVNVLGLVREMNFSVGLTRNLIHSVR